METTVNTTLNQPAILLELKDLRIGNILNYKGKNVYVSFLSMDIDDEYNELIGFVEVGKSSNEKVDWNRALISDLNPIELTSEILEKCGFELSHHGYWEFFDNNMSITWDEQTGIDISFMDSPIGTMFTHVKYLHQLQNLYFALTNEELDIVF